MTSISDLPPRDDLAEYRRVRLERLLQIAAHDFDLHFDFGNRDLIGKSHIVMKAGVEEVSSASLLLLKGRALNLLGHNLSDSPFWYEAALREEARGKVKFSLLWHALEDARVENWFIRRWPGAQKYFEANLLPNLGGRLLRRMPVVNQIELGLYFHGRGYTGARYLYDVSKVLRKVDNELFMGAHGLSARDSYIAMLEIYPKVAHWLRADNRAKISQGKYADDGKGEKSEIGDTTSDNLLPGSVPEIEVSDELSIVGVRGRRGKFPEWYRPGSAPWFERGLGKKEIHPQAVRTSRQTIVPPPRGDLESYRLMRAEVRREVGFLSHRLTNLIREEVYLRFAGYYRTGRLNKAKLWKQRIGNFRLFQRPNISSSHAVAFSLLIDESASMKGKDKYKMAMKAALLLGETLDLVSVPLEIIGYSTEEYEARAAMKLGLTPAYRYRTTRCSPLEHRIYKRFDEPYFSARIRLTGIQPRHNNWDEESLMFAFDRLQARAERRKMMIVICDGQPNGDANHLSQTIRWIESLGCKLVGVGIEFNFVRELYSNAVVVTDFQQMAGEILEILANEFRPSSI